MAFSNAGQRVADPILTRSLTEGTATDYLVDKGVIPRIDTTLQGSGIWTSDNPRAYNSTQGLNTQRSRGADRASLNLHDPLSGTFQCKIESTRTGIDLQHDPMRDQLGQLEYRRGLQSTRTTKLALEKRLKTLLFTKANWSNVAVGAIAGAMKWSDAAAGTPLADLSAVANSLMHVASYGHRPNTCVIAHDTAVAMLASAEIRGYAVAPGIVGGVGATILSAANAFADLRAKVATILGMAPERVFVGDVVEDAANAGQAAASKAAVWSDSVWLGFVATGAPLVAGGGAIVDLGPTAAADFSAFGFEAGAYTEDNGIIRQVFADSANDFVKISGDLGYLITATL